MNGYDLTRNWYNYKFSNPDKVKHIHSDLYFYTVDLWNRLGQKDKFGLPTGVTMESLNIGSYNTYKKAIADIIDFGFIKLVSDAKNQYQSKVIALSLNDEACDKALDKALVEATDESPDTIIEQRTKNKEDIDGKIFEEDKKVNPSLEEFIEYFKINNYNSELATRAWTGYNENNWKDSKNTKVKNWKQKCQNVWFKSNNSEYRIGEQISKSQQTHEEKVKKKYLKNGFYEYEKIKTKDFDNFLHEVYFEYDLDLYHRA